MQTSKPQGCCGDEIKIIKLQVDQNNAYASYSIKGIDAATTVPSIFIAASFYKIDLSFHYNNHSPPSLTGQDTYLQNCVFRI